MENLTRLQNLSLIQLGTKWGSYHVDRWGLTTVGVKEWLRNHLYFSTATLFIQGLVFSHSFVYHGIVGILVTYLTDQWKHPHFQMSAIVTNVHEGISTIMVIVLAHVSDAYFGHFRMITYTTAAYVLGLLLLWLCAGYMNFEIAARVIFGGLILVALGEAGRSASLSQFLESEYQKQQKRPDCRSDKQLRSAKEALERLPWFLGSITPLFLYIPSWENMFMISTIVMGITYLVFLLGFWCYLRNKSNPSPMEAERARRKGGYVWMLIMKLKERSYLKEMLSILLAFLVYSLVEATGSTFFIEQIANLNNPMKSINPALYLNLVTSFSKYLTPVLWSLLVPEQSSPSTNATRLRIGCGMACSVLCCVAAWQVEFYRIDQASEDALDDDDSTTISMSVLTLVPQFFLLGMMEGLAVEGVIDLFVERVGDGTDPETTRYYGSHITDFVLGIGKLIMALSILASTRTWLHDYINTSSLDQYYVILILLSSANCCYYAVYVYVTSHSYAKGNSQQSDGQELKTLPETNSSGDPVMVLVHF